MQLIQQPAVLFDVDYYDRGVHSLSQAAAGMRSEPQFLGDSFSEAPMVPRRLQFSTSPPSLDLTEERNRNEAQNKLALLLGNAFLSMLGRRARLDLQMQVA